MTSRRLLEPVTKLLLDAADYIEEHGHCRGKMVDVAGRVCAFGALFYAAGETVDLLVMKALARLKVETGTRRIADWNDEPGRTGEEVVATFRRAAALSV